MLVPLGTCPVLRSAGMTPDLAVWLNRTGLALGFCSFWLAAPELIGEVRLKMWEQKLAKGLFRLPGILDSLFTISIMIGCWALVFINWKAKRWLFHAVDIPNWWLWIFYLLFAVLVCAKLTVKPLVAWFSKRERVRQNALIVGAVLFTASFLLELLATVPASSH